MSLSEVARETPKKETPPDNRDRGWHDELQKLTSITGHHPPSKARWREDRPVRRSVALQHLDFGLPDSKTVRECISIILHYPVCGTLLKQPQEANTTQTKIFLFKDASALYQL